MMHGLFVPSFRSFGDTCKYVCMVNHNQTGKLQFSLSLSHTCYKEREEEARIQRDNVTKQSVWTAFMRYGRLAHRTGTHYIRRLCERSIRKMHVTTPPRLARPTRSVECGLFGAVSSPLPLTCVPTRVSKSDIVSAVCAYLYAVYFDF
ncbi:unnamed protein product [Toxocara canis]|uniref:HTH_21 domain-containing protein n=1 Tax=Toxocara canis TaxID=6265 RepID=A0A183UHZ9_TOXCA|nr:unnamed protein product [Toxocara canis]